MEVSCSNELLSSGADPSKKDAMPLSSVDRREEAPIQVPLRPTFASQVRPPSSTETSRCERLTRGAPASTTMEEIKERPIVKTFSLAPIEYPLTLTCNSQQNANL